MPDVLRFAVGLVVVCALGCADGGDPDDTPVAMACTADRGCPDGSVCVQGLYCQWSPGSMPDRGEPIRPGTESPSQPDASAGQVGDAGAPELDAGPPSFDGGFCTGTQLLFCDGECIDPERDSRHCGGCGLACPFGTECSLGSCLTPLPGPSL